MLRVSIGSLLSAVVLFMWGFVFWMLSPVPKMMAKGVAYEDALASALKSHLHEDGHYFVPFGCEVMQGSDEEAKKAFAKKVEDGPVARIVFRTKGDTNMGATMGIGFAHSLLCSLLAAGLLSMARIRTFALRWAFVALLGVFASAVVTMCQPIWFMASWKYSALYACFDIAGYALAAVPLAALIAPKD
ncbi:MAG: hypothetical protein K2W96_08660 [Gemmataceae bacterium]|nr:hypothetical protein [Gemmataceae bacterium]